MNKFLLYIEILLLSLFLSSCQQSANNGRNPLLNQDSFIDHIPWWITNSIDEVKIND